jgi:hypothetical protein
MWSRAYREVREGIIDQLPAMVGTSLTAPVQLACPIDAGRSQA